MEKKPWTPADRALRDLSASLEGRDEQEPVRLTVRDVRALIAKIYAAEFKAEDAAESAGSGTSPIWSWFTD